MMKKLDARGLICPLPVLKARKVLLSMEPGAELLVEATDKNTEKDFPLFCAESGHTLVKIEHAENVIRIFLRRGN